MCLTKMKAVTTDQSSFNLLWVRQNGPRGAGLAMGSSKISIRGNFQCSDASIGRWIEELKLSPHFFRLLCYHDVAQYPSPAFVTLLFKESKVGFLLQFAMMSCVLLQEFQFPVDCLKRARLAFCSNLRFCPAFFSKSFSSRLTLRNSTSHSSKVDGSETDV
jgi:hypothetical protein